jgi:hypothetical protein
MSKNNVEPVLPVEKVERWDWADSLLPACLESMLRTAR